MEMLNRAFEGADVFKKLLESFEASPSHGSRGPGNPIHPAAGHESRKQRRARELAERKARAKSECLTR